MGLFILAAPSKECSKRRRLGLFLVFLRPLFIEGKEVRSLGTAHVYYYFFLINLL